MASYSIKVFMGTIARTNVGSALEDVATYLAVVNTGSTIRTAPGAVAISTGRYFIGYCAHDR